MDGQTHDELAAVVATAHAEVPGASARARLARPPATIVSLALAASVVVGLGGAALPARADARITGRSSGGYQWPVRPFDEPHPVRAVVGDPRTSFRLSDGGNPLSGPGSFSFHNGIDIDAPSGTAVYPVVSGVVRWVLGRTGVLVETADGRFFMYRHLTPAVRQWQPVVAGETILGHVRIWADELHFSEFTRDGSIVDPLVPGHLGPYDDTTSPTVVGVQVRGPRGERMPPFNVHGRVTLTAEAYDTPMAVPAKGTTTYRISSFARDRFPVAPAAVTWSLSTLGGRTVVEPRRVVDFRLAVPPNGGFWRVYSRGTYQNRSVILRRLHASMPGRYLFRLNARLLDTRELANGVYSITVTAVDARGNRGSRTERLEIWNG